MKIGFLGLLGLIFITLKLIGVIAWSWWWWVLAPLWVPMAAFIVLVFVFTLLEMKARW